MAGAFAIGYDNIQAVLDQSGRAHQRVGYGDGALVCEDPVEGGIEDL